MDVKIINPEVLKNLYYNHGVFACTCYNTSEDLADKVGKNCQESGHMSGSRCEYIKFKITDVDRGTAEQALRHEIGVSVPIEYQDNYSIADYNDLVTNVNSDQVVKNMASFRYIDKDGFKYVTPRTIDENPDAKEIFDETMDTINTNRKKIKEILVNSGVETKQATQDANFVLPRATTTEFVIGFTPEALIHFCHKRLCSRAQEFIREMAIKMKREVYKYSPRFSKELVPHCQYLLWCPERGQSCGAYPTKDKLNQVITERIGWGTLKK